MGNFKDILIKLLMSNERFLINGELSLNHVKDSIDNLDEELLDLLYNTPQTKERFFEKNKNSDYIKFKSKDLKFFLDENQIDNSYTQFENQIGLFFDNKLLKNRGEVVLNFPFKDCVLEGGQSSDEGEDIYFEYNEKINEFEEKKSKRKEIFFNEVLGKDEIDRLKEEKVLVNWKRFTKNGEEKVGEIKRDENGLIKENLIIKGNNLLALHSLKKEFSGKIKLIYIDPPYNTGSDSFKYNDNFNHSTWLTFMKNRLEVAKELLSDDGSIYINIDYNEIHYLKILMDEIFGINNFQREIIWRMGFLSGYKTGVKNYIRNHDTILFYSKNRENMLFNKLYIENKDFKEIIPKNKETKKLFKEYSKKTKSLFKEYNINEKTTKDIYVKLDEEFDKITEEIYMKINYEMRGERYPLEDTWNCNKWDDLNSIAIESSTSRVEETINLNNENFKGQKPEKLLQRIIESSSNVGDIVLDFHLGSGTTCAVAHKLNRQYIGIDQMDYIDQETLNRLKDVITGEQGGISKNINWTGGGQFIYLELKKWNEEAKEKIMNYNNLDELEIFFNEMYNIYFLNYNVKVKDFKEKVLKNEKFRELDLEKQKKMFVSMLDLNQMYVNMSERKDKKFAISDEDIKLSEDFYNV